MKSWGNEIGEIGEIGNRFIFYARLHINKSENKPENHLALPPHLRIKDSCFPGAYIRLPARTHFNQTLTPKALSIMRYIAIIFAILGLALYGWYRHLWDDEDDLV
jgi:hypothetical protein